VSRKQSPQVDSTPVKRPAVAVEQPVPQELGELIRRDVELLSRVGWRDFVKLRRGKGDFWSLDNAITLPATYCCTISIGGHPSSFLRRPGHWTRSQVNDAIKQGPHRSCNEYVDFLEEEFVDMIQKGQVVILPASVAKQLPNLRISPQGSFPKAADAPAGSVIIPGRV
jgi:hypothetical protein